MPSRFKKTVAHSLVDQLPDDATWDDLMHKILVRASIEKGLDDSRAGKTRTTSEIRKKFGLGE